MKVTTSQLCHGEPEYVFGEFIAEATRSDPAEPMALSDIGSCR